MDCYLQSYNETLNTFKGFPIVNEKQRKTAIKWARTEKYIQIPDILTGVKIIGLEDRLNNKIFKVEYHTIIDKKDYSIIFDMYSQEMLDIMQNSFITKGIINGEIVFLDGARLALKNGIYHKQWLEKQKEHKENKETKRIPVSKLQFGHVYKTTLNGYSYAYLGKSEGMFRYVKVWICEDGSLMNLYEGDFISAKSINFKYETDTILTKEQIMENIKRLKQENNETLKQEEVKLKNKDHRYSIDGLKKSIEYFKSLLNHLGIIEEFIENYENK